MTCSFICIKASFGSSQNTYSIDMAIKKIVQNLGHTLYKLLVTLDLFRYQVVNYFSELTVFFCFC